MPWIHEKDQGPHLLCLNKTTLLHTNRVCTKQRCYGGTEGYPCCRSPPAQTRGGREVGGHSHGPEEAMEGGRPMPLTWTACPARHLCGRVGELPTPEAPHLSRASAP